MLNQVEQRIQLIIIKGSFDLVISFQAVEVGAPLMPDYHGVLLHQPIGILATDAFLSKRLLDLL